MMMETLSLQGEEMPKLDIKLFSYHMTLGQPFCETVAMLKALAHPKIGQSAFSELRPAEQVAMKEAYGGCLGNTVCLSL